VLQESMSLKYEPASVPHYIVAGPPPLLQLGIPVGLGHRGNPKP